jgi:hypothetical protein
MSQTNWPGQRNVNEVAFPFHQTGLFGKRSFPDYQMLHLLYQYGHKSLYR